MSVKDSINFTTTSFVTEVLASAGQLEKDDLNAKIGKLSNRIQQEKVDAFEDLRMKYEQFNPDRSLLALQGLSSQVDQLQTDMDQMAQRIEKEIKSQLNVSSTECENLSQQVDESHQVLNLLGRLVKIDELITSIDMDIKESNYVEASSSLREMGELLSEHVIPSEDSIEILTALENKHSMLAQNLKNVVNESWSKAIKWTIPTLSAPKKNDKVVRKTVELHIDGKKKGVLQSIAQTLAHLNLLDSKLDIFGERFMQHFVTPLATSSKTKVDITENPFSVRVTYGNDKNSPVKPLDCFTQISNILSPLSQNLFHIQVSGVGGQSTLMQRLGEKVGEEFINVITKECLAHAVPSNQRDLSAFEDVIGYTKVFQETLIRQGFMEEGNTKLTDFFGNVGALFANKRCEEILEQARKFMCSEIHNMVQVSSDHPYGKDGLPPMAIGGAKKAKMAENAALAREPKLADDSFKPPACYVSTSVVSLLELAYSTMEEACGSEAATAVQLFYCVRNMFELYCTAVPMYHKENLASLPQLAALHHNNCMYLSHALVTLGHQYRAGLQEVLTGAVAGAGAGACTFIDLVPVLRQQASAAFLNMMRAQRDQLIATLNQANGLMSLSEPGNLEAAERAVKQMLYQLQRLASVWGQVLPQNIFCKAMGTLLNAGMEKMVTEVVALEDISADDASHLHALMKQVQDRGQKLLQPPTTDDKDTDSAPVVPQKHVARWTRFSELMLVLTAGLHDIGERWAEGKGPSAGEFSAGEMKHLIRALFQNTTRRDAVLAKIK